MNYQRTTRAANELREITIQPNFLPHADGSVLISCGNTKVICTATIDQNVPSFLRGKGEGWVTAEYGMLPASNNQDAPKKFNALSAEVYALAWT